MADALGVHIRPPTNLSRSLSDSVLGADSVSASVGGGSFDILGDTEPTVGSRTRILIQDYTAGDLDGDDTVFLEENYDRYTDNGNDITYLGSGSSHYGSAARTKLYNTTTPWSLVTGRGGSGLALRCLIPTSGEIVAHTPDTQYLNTNTRAGLVIQFYFRAEASGDYYAKWGEVWDTTNNKLQFGIGGAGTGRWTTSYSNGRASVNRTPSIAPLYSDVDDGTSWNRWTMLFLPNTVSNYVYVSGDSSANELYTGAPSSRDGRLAYWLNGSLIFDYQESKIMASPVSSGFCTAGDVDSLTTIMPNWWYQYPDVINSVGAAFNMDWDDMRFWTISV